jgi:hypothetical protein
MAIIEHAFADESGGQDTRSFVMAGYLGDVEMWRTFSADWQRALDREPRVPALHMVECERFTNGFEVLDERTRQHKLDLLVAVINKHRPKAFVVQMRCRRDYPAVFRGNLPKRLTRLDHPHSICALYAATHITKLCSRVSPPISSVEFFFDWHQQCGHQTKEAFDQEIRPALHVFDPKGAHLLGGIYWPRPEERKSHVPLQAADLLAWHWRRARDYPDGKRRRTYRSLLRASKPVTMTITASDMRMFLALGYNDPQYLVPR